MRVRGSQEEITISLKYFLHEKYTRDGHIASETDVQTSEKSEETTAKIHQNRPTLTQLISY